MCSKWALQVRTWEVPAKPGTKAAGRAKVPGRVQVGQGQNQSQSKRKMGERRGRDHSLQQIRRNEKNLGRILSPSFAPSHIHSIAQSLSLSRLSFSVCNLSLLPCQARVKTKARLGLWLGRLVQGTQGHKVHIF